MTVSSLPTAAPGQRLIVRPLDDRFARLNDVMTDAIRGVVAAGAITPGATAPEVWVPELVGYAQLLRRDHGPKIKLRKIQLDWTIRKYVYGPGGTVTVWPTSHCPEITDVYGLAADYLSHLTSTARVERAHKKANEQALRSAKRKRVVEPRLLDDLDWTPSQWAAKAGVGAAVAIDYLDGKTIKLSTKTHRLLTIAINNALKAKGLPPIVLPE